MAEDRLTIIEAATRMGVPARQVRSMVKDGTIPAERVMTDRGPAYMIRPTDLPDSIPSAGTSGPSFAESAPIASPQSQPPHQIAGRPDVDAFGSPQELAPSREPERTDVRIPRVLPQDSERFSNWESDTDSRVDRHEEAKSTPIHPPGRSKTEMRWQREPIEDVSTPQDSGLVASEDTDTSSERAWQRKSDPETDRDHTAAPAPDLEDAPEPTPDVRWHRQSDSDQSGHQWEPNVESRPAQEPENISHMPRRPRTQEQEPLDLVPARMTDLTEVSTRTLEMVNESQFDDIEGVVRQIVQPLADQLEDVVRQLREADKVIGRLEAERDAALELLNSIEDPERQETPRRWWQLW